MASGKLHTFIVLCAVLSPVFLLAADTVKMPLATRDKQMMIRNDTMVYWYSGRPETRAGWHALRDVMKQYGATALRVAGCELTDSSAEAIDSHNRQLFGLIKAKYGMAETQIMEQVKSLEQYYEQISSTLPDIAAYRQLQQQALAREKSLDFKIATNEWQEAVVHVFYFDDAEKPDGAKAALLTLGIANDRAVTMKERDTSFAQFERDYIAVTDARHNPGIFSVKPLSQKEWQAAYASMPYSMIQNDTLAMALTNGSTTLLKITQKDMFYSTALRGGGKVDNGHTVTVLLEFKGLLAFAGMRELSIVVNEWRPEAVLLVSPRQLWLKVKLLYPNDNGDRVLEKSIADYIRLELPFDK